MTETTAFEKKCFVISPIGAEGSPVRQHADDVLDYIIRPATEAVGLAAIRSDRMHNPGRITEQMFEEIVGCHCCICVLTGHNPNVFYELAVAQSIGSPTIVLLAKEEELPFDIQDLRCVRYDLSPRPLFEKVYSREVEAHLRSLEAVGWSVPPLLGEMEGLLSQWLQIPPSLVAELSEPLDSRRERLSNRQKQLLFTVESLCRDQGQASQPAIAGAFGKAHDDSELYYRLEHLCLHGFLEKNRDPVAHHFLYTLYCPE